MPNELTPIQEEVHITENFQPSSFRIFSAEEIAGIQIFGKNSQGLTMGSLAD